MYTVNRETPKSNKGKQKNKKKYFRWSERLKKRGREERERGKRGQRPFPLGVGVSGQFSNLAKGDRGPFYKLIHFIFLANGTS